MKESARIRKLFRDLYDGDPWLEVNLSDTLKGITSDQASRRIAEGRNTIWEIVNHVVQWRFHVLKRLKGEKAPSPEHNFILPVEESSQQAWNRTLQELEKSQQAWLSFLEGLDENEYDEVYSENNMSYYDHIQGILQHDAYHLGQVVLLSKIV